MAWCIETKTRAEFGRVGRFYRRWTYFSAFSSYGCEFGDAWTKWGARRLLLRAERRILSS